MIQILQGDCRDMLKTIPDGSVHCCVTSPPYWGLRDYGVEGQIGQEKTITEYVASMVQVFTEVKRVLRDDGTLWLNLGDSYSSGGNGGRGDKQKTNRGARGIAGKSKHPTDGLKPKDLCGIPWRVAFALQSDGWYLRSDIIWAKKNCMPESVTDRPTRSHEYLFLLSKSPKYYYDYESIKEPCIYDVGGTGTASRKARQKETNKLLPTAERNEIRSGGFKDADKFDGKHSDKQRGHSRRHAGFNEYWDLIEKEEQCTGMRNKRDVWTISPANYPGAHFATYPPDLIRPCILAGCPSNGTVLDPFGGSGTTGEVALELGRQSILCELNPDYIPLIKTRTGKEVGFSL